MLLELKRIKYNSTNIKPIKSQGGKKGFDVSVLVEAVLGSDAITVVVPTSSEVTGAEVMPENPSSPAVWANIQRLFIFIFPS